MPDHQTPASTQGELFANDYPIPNNISVGQSIQRNLYPESLEEEKASIGETSYSNTLHDILNNKNPIYQLRYTTDWTTIQKELKQTYRYDNKDYSIRELAAMYAISKQNNCHHSLTLSLWLENPYWQFFCGIKHFQTTLPFDVSVLQSFEEYIEQHHFPAIEELCQNLELLNTPSIHPQEEKELTSKSTSKLTKTTNNHPAQLIFQPVSIYWYQDYLFYVYFLIAIGFWIIYSLIFPTNWPSEPLSLKQWQVFSYIVIGYPIVEEIIFRGGIQTWFRKYQWAKTTSLGISVANIIVSIIFSVLHIIIRPDDHTAYGIIIPSLIFGLFRDRHKHIISCTLLHVFYNLGIFILFIMPTIS